MRYLALGDSISIDDYTGVRGGGAASQFAVKLGCGAGEFENLTVNGNLTTGVLEDLARVRARPEIVTLTAGGNDFLLDRPVDDILGTLDDITARLARFECPVIVNTVYDPTDGSDALGAQMGIAPAQRQEYGKLNEGIRVLARQRSLILSDLEKLFRGNGIAAANPWIVLQIEPNLLGATAIAAHWFELYRGMVH